LVDKFFFPSSPVLDCEIGAHLCFQVSEPAVKAQIYGQKARPLIYCLYLPGE